MPPTGGGIRERKEITVVKVSLAYTVVSPGIPVSRFVNRRDREGDAAWEVGERRRRRRRRTRRKEEGVRGEVAYMVWAKGWEGRGGGGEEKYVRDAWGTWVFCLTAWGRRSEMGWGTLTPLT